MPKQSTTIEAAADNKRMTLGELRSAVAALDVGADPTTPLKARVTMSGHLRSVTIETS